MVLSVLEAAAGAERQPRAVHAVPAEIEVEPRGAERERPGHLGARELDRITDDRRITVVINDPLLRLSGLCVDLLAGRDRPGKLESLRRLAVTCLETLRVLDVKNDLRALPVDRSDLRTGPFDRLSVDMLKRPIRVALADFLLADRMDVGLAEGEKRDRVAVGEERRELVQLAAHVGVHGPGRHGGLALLDALEGVRLRVELVRTDFRDDARKLPVVGELGAPSLDQRLEELGILAVAEVAAALIPDRARDRHRIERMDETRVHRRRGEHGDRPRVFGLPQFGILPGFPRRLFADAGLERQLASVGVAGPEGDRKRLVHPAGLSVRTVPDLVAHRDHVRSGDAVLPDRTAIAVVRVPRAAEGLAVEVGHVLPEAVVVADRPVLLEIGRAQHERRAEPHLAGVALWERIVLESLFSRRDRLPRTVVERRLVKRRFRAFGQVAGIVALAPLDDRLLVPRDAALLQEVLPPVVPEVADPLAVPGAVLTAPELVEPAVDLRRAPGRVDESDRNVERLVELPAHPVERRAVLAHRVVGRRLPADADRVLARERVVAVVAVAHEKRADVRVALRLLQEFLAADRKTSVPREGVGHVRLSAPEPDVAEENVRDRNRLARARRGDCRRLLVRLLDRQLHGPAPVLRDRRLADGGAVERELHGLPGFAEAPDGRGDVALQDRVVRDDGRKLELSGPRRNRGKDQDEDDGTRDSLFHV